MFGQYIRERREALKMTDRRFSLRQVAQRVGIEPSYLSKIERGEEPAPSVDTIRKIAGDLAEDADILMALAGKISHDLKAVILQRPRLFAHLIREMKDMPDHAVLRLVREVRDGHW